MRGGGGGVCWRKLNRRALNIPPHYGPALTPVMPSLCPDAPRCVTHERSDDAEKLLISDRRDSFLLKAAQSIEII